MYRFASQSTRDYDSVAETGPDTELVSVKTYHAVEDFQTNLFRTYGEPTSKSIFNRLDIIAVLLSIVCLVIGLIVINPDYPYAASLRKDRQIIVIGFLLGVMNQCLQRIIPYLFVLVECRFGASTLQNYEGLLRWSPFVSKLSIVWRLALISLTAMPLGLSVLYKRFDGRASKSLPSNRTLCLPTGPPGLQGSIGWNQVMANTTVPFMSAANDSVSLPTDISFSSPKVYGFNTMLLTNTTAVAIDAPRASRIIELQQKLPRGGAIYLNAIVRGSVAQYNVDVGDEGYWNEFYGPNLPIGKYSTFDGFTYAIAQAGVATGDSPELFDGSWILAGSIRIDTYDPTWQDYKKILPQFLENAVRFDVKRHNCTAKWRITPNSIELESGSCDPQPLEDEYQYFGNCQLSLVDILGRSITDSLGDFGNKRLHSQWKMPTYAIIIASAYQSILAAREGYVPIQLNGPIWRFHKVPDGTNFYENYTATVDLRIQVPALDANIGLYAVIILQPLLTIFGFVTVAFLFHVPLSRTFGLVSIMAGANKEDLALLSGASFSGELKQPVGLRIKVLSVSADSGHDGSKIEYRLGTGVTTDKVRRRVPYE